jgi:hypothetical protein
LGALGLHQMRNPVGAIAPAISDDAIRTAGVSRPPDQGVLAI